MCLPQVVFYTSMRKPLTRAPAPKRAPPPRRAPSPKRAPAPRRVNTPKARVGRQTRALIHSR